MWILVVKKFATLWELKTVYSFEDGLCMHEVIIEMTKDEKRALEKKDRR